MLEQSKISLPYILIRRFHQAKPSKHQQILLITLYNIIEDLTVAIYRSAQNTNLSLALKKLTNWYNKRTLAPKDTYCDHSNRVFILKPNRKRKYIKNL